MTMKGRRPKGWVNPYKRDDRATIVEGDYLMELESCYEAGADAMYDPAYNKGKEDGKKELREECGRS